MAITCFQKANSFKKAMAMTCFQKADSFKKAMTITYFQKANSFKKAMAIHVTAIATIELIFRCVQLNGQ